MRDRFARDIVATDDGQTQGFPIVSVTVDPSLRHPLREHTLGRNARPTSGRVHKPTLRLRKERERESSETVPLLCFKNGLATSTQEC